MKRILLIIFTVLLISPAFTQSLKETAVKRFSIGGDIFTDIWMNWPEGIDVRTINQGASFFGMYNYPFGEESNYSFAVGIGMSFHNMYSNSVITNIRADSIVFNKIPDSVGYKKSKIGLSYIEVPIEFRFKSDTKFRVAIGCKVGYLIDAKTKYKGPDDDFEQIVRKSKQIKNLEKFAFGPQIRIGYDWFSLFAYYQVTNVFIKNKGPNNLYPISVGITLLPF